MLITKKEGVKMTRTGFFITWCNSEGSYTETYIIGENAGFMGKERKTKGKTYIGVVIKTQGFWPWSTKEKEMWIESDGFFTETLPVVYEI